MVVGRLLWIPRKTRDADKRRVHLVRPTPRPAPSAPRPALPEVRCLTLEVPARRGWRSVVNRDASAVAGFERARGVGLLVSGPGSGPGCGWSRDLDLPLEVSGAGAPLSPPPAFGLSAGGRPQAPARPLCEAGPSCDARSFWRLQVRDRGATRVPLSPATASCRPAVSLVPRVDTSPGLGGTRVPD